MSAQIEVTPPKETPKEYAQRMQDMKKAAIDQNGRKATVLIANTYEAKDLVSVARRLDEDFSELRNNIGRRGGPNQVEFDEIMKSWNTLTKAITTFGRHLRRKKYKAAIKLANSYIDQQKVESSIEVVEKIEVTSSQPETVTDAEADRASAVEEKTTKKK